MSNHASTQGHGHGTARAVSEEDDEDDPVERMLKAQGCLQQHYDVQHCIAGTKDWRKCQDVVEAFRLCIEKSKQAKGGGGSTSASVKK